MDPPENLIFNLKIYSVNPHSIMNVKEAFLFPMPGAGSRSFGPALPEFPADSSGEPKHNAGSLPVCARCAQFPAGETHHYSGIGNMGSEPEPIRDVCVAGRLSLLFEYSCIPS